jgi:hypothetical protein
MNFFLYSIVHGLFYFLKVQINITVFRMQNKNANYLFRDDFDM